MPSYTMVQSQIIFRLKISGWHLLASMAALAILVGGLFLGWYRWPGWYLADVGQVIRMVIGVNLVVGPLLTLVIASPAKKPRILARDLGTIIAVQLLALGYGSFSMWSGRPLYFAFSEDVLQLVQAYDISVSQAALGRKDNPELAPYWYSRPRWIWAPLPDGPERDSIVAAAVSGGDDVIAMPQHYRPWDQGAAALRSQLKKLDDVKYFSANEKKILKAQLQAVGLPADQANCIAMTGRGHPLLAVLNPKDLSVTALLRAH